MGRERGCTSDSPRLGMAMPGPRVVSLRERTDEPRKVLGCQRELKVKNSHGVWLLDVIFSPVWGHLRAISNSSGNSLLSFCTAMSAMGPRITTGRLKLAVGGQRYSGWVGARAELPAPEYPAPLLSVPTGLQLALLLPGEGGPSASAAGQPQDQCPQSGSGCPGAHLPSGPPSHMVDSAPAL